MNSHSIKIAILDSVPKMHWNVDNGITDGQKFVSLLEPNNKSVKFDIFYVSEYEFPENIASYDGYLLTGSPASVHDNYEWIKMLSEFIDKAHNKNKPIVGVCFGHQLIAKHFGGIVDNNEKGWMIGSFSLDIKKNFPWMKKKMITTDLFHFNKERVTKLPEDAISFANSEDYPHYAYTIGSNILCLQGHPEQPKRAMYNFLEETKSILSEKDIEKANTCIEIGKSDSTIWSKWIMDFFYSNFSNVEK